MTARFACVCGQLVVVSDADVGLEGACPLCGRYLAAVPTNALPGAEPVPSARPLRFACRCGQLMVVPASAAGLTGECPRCGERVRAGASRLQAQRPVLAVPVGQRIAASVVEAPVFERRERVGETRRCPLCRETIHSLARYCLACRSAVLGASRLPPAGSGGLPHVEEARARLALACALLGAISGGAPLALVGAALAARLPGDAAGRVPAISIGLIGAVVSTAALYVWLA